MRIAIDLTSGDNAAAVLLAGVVRAVEETGATVLAVGEQATLEKALADNAPAQGKIEIVGASGVIGMDESPVRALAKNPQASVAVAGGLVAEGKADLFISPGNTGATMVVAAQKLGRLQGVMRPCLLAPLANVKGKPAVLVDVGASAECNHNHLVQFAVMGTAYAEGVLGLEEPSVALLNNGTEPGKGTEVYKKAHKELAGIGLNFSGNIEGFELFFGAADVVVCDGFLGNIVIKALESAAMGVMGSMEKALGGGEKVASAAKAVREKVEHKGAVPLLGVKGGCLVMHGRADDTDAEQAVKLGVKVVAGKLPELIAGKLQELGLGGE